MILFTAFPPLRKEKMCVGRFISSLQLMLLLASYYLPWGKAEWNQLGNDIVGTVANERCGRSSAMNGNGSILAVGSTLYGVSSTLVTGRARVFFFDNYRGEWVQMGDDLVGEQDKENYGYSVSLNEEGNILAVGSYLYSLSAATSSHVGRALVFSYNGSHWLPLGNQIVGEQSGEQCGASVSLSANGTVLSVGCIYYGVSYSLFDVGRTIVYSFNGTMWVEKGSSIVGSQTSEHCGWSISLNAAGTVVTLGCYLYDVSLSNSTLVDAGRVQVYSYNGTEWVKMGDDIVGTQAYENFGYSLSLNAEGTTVAAGSIGYSSSSLLQAGRVRVYAYNGNSAGWNILGSPLNGSQAGESFGNSVVLNGDGSKLVVGASVYSTPAPSLSNAGRAIVYIYRRGAGWLQWGSDIMGSNANEQAGGSVSISYDGSNLAIGSRLYNPTTSLAKAGRIRVFSNITYHPTSQPSSQPSSRPSRRPTGEPTVPPSSRPSGRPSSSPSLRPLAEPSLRPSSLPSSQPSSQPSNRPSQRPTDEPTGQPSSRPSGRPSISPSVRPLAEPSLRPSSLPSSQPSSQPSSRPSRRPTDEPTGQPSSRPSGRPSSCPSVSPSFESSLKPSSLPSSLPSSQPSSRPSRRSAGQPSGQPSGQQSSRPSSSPSVSPSAEPSLRPSSLLTSQPSSQPSGRPTMVISGYSIAPTTSKPSKAPSVGSKTTTTVVTASNSSSVEVRNISGNSLTIGSLTSSSTATVTVTSLSNSSSSGNKNASALASHLKSDIITVTVTNSSSDGAQFTANISISNPSSSNSSSSLAIFEHNCTVEMKEEVVYDCLDAKVVYNLTCSGEASARVEQQCPVSQLQCSVIDMNTYNVVDSDYCTVVSSTKTSVQCKCGYSSSNNTGSSTSPPSSSPTSKSSSVSVAVTSEYVTGDFSATVSVVGGLSSAAAVEGTMAVLSAFGCLWLVGLLMIGSMFVRMDGGLVWRSLWSRVVDILKKAKLRRVRTRGVIMPLNDSRRGEGVEKVRRLWVSYVMEVMPKVFRPRCWLHRMWEELCDRHEYLELLVWWLGSGSGERGVDKAKSHTGSKKADESRRSRIGDEGSNMMEDERWEKVLSVGRLLTSITISCFLLAWLYDLQYPDDDGSCGQHLTSESCLSRKSPLDSGQSYCKWQTARAVTAAVLVESKQRSVLSSTVIAATLTDAELHSQCQYADSQASLLATMLVAVAVSFISTVVTRAMVALFSVILAPTLQGEGKERARQGKGGSWWIMSLYVLGELFQVDLLQRVMRYEVSGELRLARQAFLRGCSEQGGEESVELRKDIFVFQDGVSNEGEGGEGSILSPEVEDDHKGNDLHDGNRRRRDSVEEDAVGRTSESMQCMEMGMIIDEHESSMKKRGKKKDARGRLQEMSVPATVPRDKVVEVHRQLLCHAEDMDTKAAILLHVYLYDIVHHHSNRVAAEILWQTMTKDYRLPSPSVSMGVKWACGCLILGLNMGALLFICLKGLSRGKVWQGDFLEACAIQWVLDVVFVSVVEILCVDFGIPGLAYVEVLEKGYVGLLRTLDSTLKHLGSGGVRKQQVSTDAACARTLLRTTASFTNEVASQSRALSMSAPMEQLVSDEVCYGLPEARVLLLGCRQHVAHPGSCFSSNADQEVKKVGGEEVVASSASCRWSRKVSVAPMTMPREGVEFSSEEREGLKARVVRSAESVGGEEHLPIQAKTEAGGLHAGWSKLCSGCISSWLCCKRMLNGWGLHSLCVWLVLNMSIGRQRLFVRFFAPLSLAGVILAWSYLGKGGSSAAVSAYEALFVLLIILLSLGSVWKSIHRQDSSLASHGLLLREEPSMLVVGGPVNGDVGGESSTAGAGIDVGDSGSNCAGGLVYEKEREGLVGKVPSPAVEVLHEEECSELSNVCEGHEGDSCFLHEEVHVGGSEEEEVDLTISFLFSDYSSFSHSSVSSRMEEISLGSSSRSSIEKSMNGSGSESDCEISFNNIGGEDHGYG
eukprot:scaffold801_cov178-Ochromonas_danica.AAC.4